MFRFGFKKRHEFTFGTKRNSSNNNEKQLEIPHSMPFEIMQQ